jgi:hypothetical protein
MASSLKSIDTASCLWLLNVSLVLRRNTRDITHLLHELTLILMTSPFRTAAGMSKQGTCCHQGDVHLHPVTHFHDPLAIKDMAGRLKLERDSVIVTWWMNISMLWIVVPFPCFYRLAVFRIR